MHPSRILRRPSPAMTVALLALVVAMAGSAGATPQAVIAKLSKSKVKTIAKSQAGKVIKKKASSLSVNRARSADSATTAVNATRAATAGRADTAGTADSATTAGSAAPSGAAGGALSGEFPNPALAAASVSAATLKGVTLTNGINVAIAAGATGTATVGCSNGGRVLSFGWDWSNNAEGTSILTARATSATTVSITGNVAAGATNQSLRAFALCLQA